MAVEHMGNDVAERAIRIVKLTRDLDSAIRMLRSQLPAARPWQRALIALLDEADRRMQIVRMTELTEKPDDVIANAVADLAMACRRVGLAVQGSRAEAQVRASAQSIGKSGDTLRKLVVEAVAALAADEQAPG